MRTIQRPSTWFVLILAMVVAPPAHAHGGKKSVPATVVTPQVLGASESGGLRFSARATRDDALEIEVHIERKLDPPDPVLGAWTPLADARVTISLVDESGSPVSSEDAHGEGEAGVYGVHLADVAPGRYTVQVAATPATEGAVVITVGFPLDLSTATMDPGAPMMEMDMTHPFLAHMGLPDPPGAASFRLTGMRRSSSLGSGSDMAIHVEAGVLPRLGIHLRNDAITGNAAGEAGMPAEEHGTEFMLMYAFLQNAEGTSGLSVFGEVSWPTVKGDGRTANVGGGVAGRYQWSNRLLFDADVHVAPEMGGVEMEFESSLQVRPAGRLYGIIETRGNFGPGDTKIYLLPAVKVGLGRSNGAFGVGLQFPLTAARDYDRQAMFQLDWDF